MFPMWDLTVKDTVSAFASHKSRKVNLDIVQIPWQLDTTRLRLVIVMWDRMQG